MTAVGRMNLGFTFVMSWKCFAHDFEPRNFIMVCSKKSVSLLPYLCWLVYKKNFALVSCYLSSVAKAWTLSGFYFLLFGLNSKGREGRAWLGLTSISATLWFEVSPFSGCFDWRREQLRVVLVLKKQGISSLNKYGRVMIHVWVRTNSSTSRACQHPYYRAFKLRRSLYSYI